MLQLIRTDSNNLDFQNLVVLLDKELGERDGDDHSFYAQFNKIDKIKHAIVAYKNEIPAGCGAIKKYSEKGIEIKRMFVKQDLRGQGIARQILGELEKWAGELGFSECVLETGKKQPEAIHLYQQCGYQVIENYGQYINVENSICMCKKIR